MAAKNVGKEEVDSSVNEVVVPLSVKLGQLARDIDTLKLTLYPEGKKMDKVYSDQAPKKREFNALRKLVNQLKKEAIKMENKNQRKKDAENKPKKELRMVKIHDNLAELVKCEEKGLKGGVYSDILLTSWITNYACHHKLKRGKYIVPDTTLIKIFHDALRQNGIINSKGELLKRKDDKGVEFVGIQFTELQKLIKTKVVTVFDTAKGKDKYQIIPPLGNEDLSRIIEQERTEMKEYGELRKRGSDVQKQIAAKKELVHSAEKHGDEKFLQAEINALESELKKINKQLIETGRRYFE